MNRTFARRPERFEMRNTLSAYAGSPSAASPSAAAALAWQDGQTIPATLPRSSLATAQLANSGLVLGGTGRPHSLQVERSGGAAMARRYPVRHRATHLLVPAGTPATREGPGRWDGKLHPRNCHARLRRACPARLPAGVGEKTPRAPVGGKAVMSGQAPLGGGEAAHPLRRRSRLRCSTLRRAATVLPSPKPGVPIPLTSAPQLSGAAQILLDAVLAGEMSEGVGQGASPRATKRARCFCSRGGRSAPANAIRLWRRWPVRRENTGNLNRSWRVGAPV